MNYIEAVRELVNNPKAEAIIFRASSDDSTLQLKINNNGVLSFFGKTGASSSLHANHPEFVLREDFTILYKEEKKYTAKQLTESCQKAFQDGYMRGSVVTERTAEAKAFKKFKEAMKDLIGE